MQKFDTMSHEKNAHVSFIDHEMVSIEQSKGKIKETILKPVFEDYAKNDSPIRMKEVRLKGSKMVRDKSVEMPHERYRKPKSKSILLSEDELSGVKRQV